MRVDDPWLESQYFADDDIKHPFNTNPQVVILMDEIREFFGCPVVIHRCHDPEASPKSQHYVDESHAIDFHVVTDMSLFDQFIALTRFPGTGAIGVYPYWNNPGFHIDMRDGERAYWIADANKHYVALDEENTDKHIIRRMKWVM